MNSVVRPGFVHSRWLAIAAACVAAACSAQQTGADNMVSSNDIAAQFLKLPDPKIIQYDEDLQLDLMDRISDVEFTGLAIAAPQKVDASSTDEIPLILVSQFDAMRNWRVDLEKNCIVLAVHLDSGEVMAGRAFVDEKLDYTRGAPAEEPASAMPEGDAANAITTGVEWLDAKVDLDGPWRSGRYAITLISFDSVSNTVVVELDNGAESPETGEDSVQVYPAPGGSPPTAAYTQVANSPAPPAVGAVIRMTRDHPSPVTSLPVHGAFTVATREQYLLDDEQRAQQMQETGTPVAAIVPITMVTVGVDWPRPVLGNWRAPVYSQETIAPGVGTLRGYFTVDMAAVDEEMRLEAGFYAVYAVLEDMVAGPAPLAVK